VDPCRCNSSGGRSPRTRGDGPVTRGGGVLDANVLPAHAGMARLSPGNRHHRGRSPRTRGDGPAWPALLPFPIRVLPAHAGMARSELTFLDEIPGVLPAHAEMALRTCFSFQGFLGSPRTMRGWLD